jgi:hypothetical protein
MKNLKKLKVPGLLGKNEREAIDVLTAEQRTDLSKKLAYTTHILTGTFRRGRGRTPGEIRIIQTSSFI